MRTSKEKNGQYHQQAGDQKVDIIMLIAHQKKKKKPIKEEVLLKRNLYINVVTSKEVTLMLNMMLEAHHQTIGSILRNTHQGQRTTSGYRT